MNRKTHLTGGHDLLFLHPLNSDTTSVLKELKSINDGEKFGQQLRDACKQLSQLVAWMWHPGKINQQTKDDEKQDEDEKNLKRAFDGVLKYQAFNNKEDGSEAIKNLLLGRNDKIQEVYGGPIPNITLGEIYEELTSGQKYVFNESYLKNFYTEVVVNTFDGDVSFDFFGTDNPTGESKFIVVIAYPPRPELNEFTITQNELKTWATDVGNYEPPNFNPYIPVAGST